MTRIILILVMSFFLFGCSSEWPKNAKYIMDETVCFNGEPYGAGKAFMENDLIKYVIVSGKKKLIVYEEDVKPISNCLSK